MKWSKINARSPTPCSASCNQQQHVALQVGQFLLQFSDNLPRSKQEGQAQTVDLHTLSVKEARAAVLCVLCNIQVRRLDPLLRNSLLTPLLRV